MQRGEVVGIPSTRLRTGIGRNGAGKSALPSTELRTRLKILSRITEPTSGHV
jgi:ABC-type polysaccharide/polyol phosphate transport system ATPase subunit